MRSPVFDTVEIKTITYFWSFIFGYIFFYFVKSFFSVAVFTSFTIIISLRNIKHVRLKHLTVIIIIFFTGYLFGYLPYNNVKTKYSEIYKENFSADFRIVSDVEYKDSYISFETEIVSGEHCSEKCLVTLYETPGDNIKINTRLSLSNLELKSLLPYEIDKQILYASSKFTDGIFLVAVGDNTSVKNIQQGNFNIKQLFSDVKAKLNSILASNLDKNQYDFISGVLTGYKDYNNVEFNEILNRNGISHVVVVSGMHFSILIFMILAFLRLFYISMSKAAIITIVFSFFLALFFGMTPSVLRALIISDLFLLADVFWKDKTSSMHFLILTAVIMIVSNPFIIYDIGFVLSFSSVLGINLFSDKLNKLLGKLPTGLRQIIATTVAANIPTLPLLAYYFNTLSFGFLIGNLIITPIIFAVMIYSIIAIILTLIFEVVGSIMFVPLNFLLNILFAPLNFISDLSWLHYDVNRPSFDAIMLYYTGLALCINLKSFKKIKWVLSGTMFLYFLISLFICEGYPINTFANYYALGNFQSGKVVINKSGKTIVCDLSDSSEFYDLKTILKKQSRSEVDLYIIGNTKSLEALYSLCDEIKVKKVLYPACFNRNILYTEKISNTSDSYFSTDKVDEISIGDLRVKMNYDDALNILSAEIINNSKKSLMISRDFNVIPSDTNLNILSAKKIKYYSNNNIDINNKIINFADEKLYVGCVK